MIDNVLSSLACEYTMSLVMKYLFCILKVFSKRQSKVKANSYLQTGYFSMVSNHHDY